MGDIELLIRDRKVQMDPIRLLAASPPAHLAEAANDKVSNILNIHRNCRFMNKLCIDI